MANGKITQTEISGDGHTWGRLELSDDPIIIPSQWPVEEPLIVPEVVTFTYQAPVVDFKAELRRIVLEALRDGRVKPKG